jgi:hypothetical protein
MLFQIATVKLSNTKQVLKRGVMLENERYAFISGHTETYKVGVMILKKRLKILGTMGTKNARR